MGQQLGAARLGGPVDRQCALCIRKATLTQFSGTEISFEFCAQTTKFNPSEADDSQAMSGSVHEVEVQSCRRLPNRLTNWAPCFLVYLFETRVKRRTLDARNRPINGPFPTILIAI